MIRQILRVRALQLAGAAAAAAALVVMGCGGGSDGQAQQAALAAEGRQIFRFDTFGDEAFWTDTLRMHEVISAAVDPVTALSVGLKVDAEALPAAVVDGIKNGSIDLKSPATTIALLPSGSMASTASRSPAMARRSPTGIAMSRLPKWAGWARWSSHA